MWTLNSGKSNGGNLTLRFHAWNCWNWKLKKGNEILNQGGSTAHIYLRIICDSIEAKNVCGWNVALAWHQQPFGDFICCWIRWCTNQKMYIRLVQMVELFMLKRQRSQIHIAIFFTCIKVEISLAVPMFSLHRRFCYLNGYTYLWN